MPSDPLRHKKESIKCGKGLRSVEKARKQDSEEVLSNLFKRIDKGRPAQEPKGQSMEPAIAEEMDVEMAAGNNLDDVDQLMEVDGANKENFAQSVNANSQDLLDMVERENIVVKSKTDDKQIQLQSGQEAYFALLAQDMY